MKIIPSQTNRHVTLPETGIAGFIVKVLGALTLSNYVAQFSVITFIAFTTGFASYQPLKPLADIVGKMMGIQFGLAVYSLPFWRTEERRSQAQKPSP